MDEVLKLTLSPIMTVIDNLLHLIFLFITNQFWWWTLKLGARFISFFVTG